MEDRFSNPKHIKWAKAVKERDCYECQICYESGGFLHSHHMNSFDIFVEQRFDINNGVTLCQPCHMRFHGIYGHSKNTRHQYEEYKNMMLAIHDIVREGRKV